MRENPERTAWIVLLSAFAVFCLLAVSIPWGIRNYLYNKRVPHAIFLTVQQGTVFVKRPGAEKATGIKSEDGSVPVEVGSSVESFSDSQAELVIRQAGRETAQLGTIQLYPDTRVVLERADSPRFGVSPYPHSIIVALERGRVRIVVAPPQSRTITFAVETPQATTYLEEDGGYSLRVTSEGTQVIVRTGQAAVSAERVVVNLSANQRAMVPLNSPPEGPQPAEQNLVANGDFREPLVDRIWVLRKDQMFQDLLDEIREAGLKGRWVRYRDRDDSTEPFGEARLVPSGDRQAVFFTRTGDNKYRGDIGIVQILDQDVRDYDVLKLQLSVKLLYQSVSGGGVASTEFPLMIRLDYKDTYGSDRHWVHGFYYENPAEYPVHRGEQILRNVWWPYESGNFCLLYTSPSPRD